MMKTGEKYTQKEENLGIDKDAMIEEEAKVMEIEEEHMKYTGDIMKKGKGLMKERKQCRKIGK